MANEQSGIPLRRWRPFYGAFDAIDGAIEEAGGHPRAAFLDVRAQIVRLLRAATDDGVAEQLCAALDDAMAEALETLRVAPVPHTALASTDLAKSVDALAKHSSARIRRLAGDVVRGWKAANVATTASAKEELAKLPADDRIPRQAISATIADGNARGRKEKLHIPPAKMLPTVPVAEAHMKKVYVPPAKMLPIATTECKKIAVKEELCKFSADDRSKEKLHVQPAKMLPAATEVHKKKLHIPPEKMLPIATTESTPSTRETKKLAVDESKKMEATKRKLHEGYEAAERIKRQHTIKKIDDKDAAKVFEEKQRKMHPIVRGRSSAACRSRTSSGVRRSLLPSLQMT